MAVPPMISRGAVRFSPCAQRVTALLLFGVVAGCGDKGRPNQAEEDSPLKPIARFYGEYILQHERKPPPSEAEFKAYLKDPKITERLKEEFKIADVDKMLISPRDNKPFVIFYGVLSKNSGPGGAPVVGYEQVGAAGKRFVASTLGAVVEVDDAEFRKLVPDAK
jgi:hypothetical protein